MSDEYNDNGNQDNNDDGSWDDGEIVKNDTIFKKFTPDSKSDDKGSEKQKTDKSK